MNNNFYNPYVGMFCDLPKSQCSCAAQSCDADTNTAESGCERRMKKPIPENVAYAMAYVPFQSDIECYDCFRALKSGTLFPALDKPFTGCCRYE